MLIQGGGHKGGELAGLVAARMEAAAIAEAAGEWEAAAACYMVIEGWAKECKLVCFNKAVAAFEKGGK